MDQKKEESVHGIWRERGRNKARQSKRMIGDKIESLVYCVGSYADEYRATIIRKISAHLHRSYSESIKLLPSGRDSAVLFSRSSTLTEDLHIFHVRIPALYSAQDCTSASHQRPSTCFSLLPLRGVNLLGS